MKEEFCNTILLSGFINSKVQRTNKHSFRKGKLSFYLSVPKGLKSNQRNIPVLVNCWENISDSVFDLLDGKFGVKVTCLCSLEADIVNGQQYYAFRMKDFCFGWHDLLNRPELGEMQRKKRETLVIDKIIEDTGEI